MQIRSSCFAKSLGRIFETAQAYLPRGDSQSCPVSGEYGMAKEAVGHIPEIYFTKLQVAAELLDGEDMFEAAVKQKSLSFEHLITMLSRLAEYYSSKGEYDKAKIELKAAIEVYDAFRDDFATKYTHRLHDWYGELRERIVKQLAEIENM